MQVCTGVMLHGYGMVKQLCGELQVSKQDTLLLAFAFIVLLDSVSRVCTLQVTHLHYSVVLRMYQITLSNRGQAEASASILAC